MEQQHSETSPSEAETRAVPSQSQHVHPISSTPPTPMIGLDSVRTPPTPRTAAFSRVSADLSRSHGRTMSGVDAGRKSKRFSLTFPINTTAIQAARTPSPTRSFMPSSLPDSTPSTSVPTDSSFLTAVAAQERRVLELKEELNKAEGELKRLKHEWALHEAQRKRHDVRRLQQLKPLKSPTAAPSAQKLEDDTDGSSAWMQQEMERRKALLSGSKTSNRTVFSGSRHARTLSLLSPVAPSAKFPQPRDVDVRTRSRSPTAPERPTLPTRIPTDDLLTRDIAETSDVNIDLGIPRDVLMKTGKQMATDFRDGLWTFIEDLRQATVGDEGVNGTTTRTQGQMDQKSLRQHPSRGSLRQPTKPQSLKRSSTTNARRRPTPSPARSKATLDDSALLDLGATFWRENGVDEGKIEERPAAKKPSKKKSQILQRGPPAPEENFESWETWDSPEPKPKPERSNSDTSVSDNQTSPSPNGTSPRTSVR